MGYDPTGCWKQDWKTQANVGVVIILIGLAILLAPPTGGASLGALAIGAGTIATGVATVAIGTVMVGDALSQSNVSFAKPSKKSGKERSTQHPSWVSESDINTSRSAQENATDLLDQKYGEGNWSKGPKSEFNQIVKWINRSIKVISLILVKMIQEDPK